MPPGPGQDRLVEVGSVPVDTAGALGKAGQGVLHYYHECYQYYYDCCYHLENGAASAVNVGLGCVGGVTCIKYQYHVRECIIFRQNTLDTLSYLSNVHFRNYTCKAARPLRHQDNGNGTEKAIQGRLHTGQENQLRSEAM